MDIAISMDVSDKWGEKMSRLIRYDDAIERLGAHLMANAQIDWGETASTDIEGWKELADMILNGVPTIDAVSVVRCKDCKYWHDHITTTWCSRGAELRPQESGWIKRNADKDVHKMVEQHGR